MNETMTAGPQATYEAYLRDGRFMIQHSPTTGEYVFYPKVLTPSGATDIEWVEPSGLGTVYAITVNRARNESWNIALIDLDEGVRMLSTIVGAVTLPIGTRVRAEIEIYEGNNRVVFRAVEGGGHGA